MIRLILVIGLAVALWPVGKDNRPMGVDSINVSAEDVVSAGYSVVADIAGFCSRNAETCETVTTVVSSTATSIQQKVTQSTIASSETPQGASQIE